MVASDYLTVEEAAAELGLAVAEVDGLIERGELKAIRGTAHGTRVPRIALDAYQRRVAGEEPEG